MNGSTNNAPLAVALHTHKIDSARSVIYLPLLESVPYTFVFNHLKQNTHYWILPQRRELTLLMQLLPKAGNWYSMLVPMLILLLVLTSWMLGRTSQDNNYKSIIYTVQSLIRVCLSTSLPILPKSNKLTNLLFFLFLTCIPLNVGIQTVWTTTSMHIVREPKITNLRQLARSDIPMKFGPQMTIDFETLLDAESAEMMKKKWVPRLKYGEVDELYGRTGTATIFLNIEILHIRNIEQVEMFEQVRNEDFVYILKCWTHE